MDCFQIIKKTFRLLNNNLPSEFFYHHGTERVRVNAIKLWTLADPAYQVRKIS